MVYKGVWDTRKAETTAKERAVRLHAFDCGGGGGVYLVNFIATVGGRETARDVEICLSPIKPAHQLSCRGVVPWTRFAKTAPLCGKSGLATA